MLRWRKHWLPSIFIFHWLSIWRKNQILSMYSRCICMCWRMFAIQGNQKLPIASLHLNTVYFLLFLYFSLLLLSFPVSRNRRYVKSAFNEQWIKYSIIMRDDQQEIHKLRHSVTGTFRKMHCWIARAMINWRLRDSTAERVEFWYSSDRMRKCKTVALRRRMIRRILHYTP